MDNDRKNNILEMFFNHNLVQDLAACRSDLGKMSNVMNHNARIRKNKQIGGGKDDTKVIEKATTMLLEKLPLDPLSDMKMDELKQKVNSFSKHINYVIDEISKISNSSTGMDKNMSGMLDIRREYESFSQKLRQIITDKG